MKIVKKIIIWIITILLVLLFTFNIYNFVCVNILKQDLATINGYGILEVISGSMEPTIHVGDLVIINTNETNYEPNDIVTFYDVNGAFVTHRILSIKDGKMVTQGDNNNAADESISTDNIVGKYVFQIPLAGRILESLRSPFTMVMILLIGILICMLLSMDSNGEPILTEEEKEYREFQEAQKKKKLQMAYAEEKSEPLLVEKVDVSELPVDITELIDVKEETKSEIIEEQEEVIKTSDFEEVTEEVVEPVTEEEIKEEVTEVSTIKTKENKELTVPEEVVEPIVEEVVEQVTAKEVGKEEVVTPMENEHRIELKEKEKMDTYLLNKEEYGQYLEYCKNKKEFKHFLKFQTNKKQYKEFHEFNRMKIEFEKFLDYCKNKGKYKKYQKYQKKEYKKYQKLEKLERKKYLKIQKQKEKENKRILKKQLKKQEYQRFLEYQRQEYKGFIEYQSKGKIEIPRSRKNIKNKRNKKKEK